MDNFLDTLVTTLEKRHPLTMDARLAKSSYGHLWIHGAIWDNDHRYTFCLPYDESRMDDYIEMLVRNFYDRA